MKGQLGIFKTRPTSSFRLNTDRMTLYIESEEQRVALHIRSSVIAYVKHSNRH